MTETAHPPARLVANRYRLIDRIGSGGMGTVWRAHDEVLRRDVAIKEFSLPADMPAPEQDALRERMLREARAAAALAHSSVITIYDVVEADGRPWIVMELLAARSLRDVIAQEGPLPPDRVADIGRQLLGALTTAHRAGVLHRDVKPGNILLDADGHATLGDFGVARARHEPALTGTGILVGSPSYMAPERARGEEPTEASDLWALGATLFMAVEGRSAFDRGDPLPTLSAVVSEPPAPYRNAGALAQVLDGLLTKDPYERWAADRTRIGLDAAIRSGAATARGARSVTAIPAESAGIRRPDRGGFLDDVFTTAMFSIDLDAPAPTADNAGTGSPIRTGTSAAPPRRYLPPVGERPRPRRHLPLRVRRRRSRRPAARLVPRVAAVVVALALLSWAGYALGQQFSGTDPAPRAAQPPSSAPGPSSPPPAASSSPSASPSPTPSQRTVTDPLGFRAVVPVGWSPQRHGDTVDYVSPGGDRFLRFRISAAPSSDQAATFRAGERTFTRRSEVADYARITIADAQVARHSGAVWKFRYTDTNTHQTRHVYYEAFVQNGTSYQLYLSAPQNQWAATAGVLRAAAGSYRVVP